MSLSLCTRRVNRQSNRSRLHSHPAIYRAALGALGFAVAAMLPGQTARAADTTESVWNGSQAFITNEGDWSNTLNWTPNTVPSATVSAEFNSAFTNQPLLTTTSTAQGIWDTGATPTTGASGLTTMSGSGGGGQALTITGTATLDGLTNSGILLDGVGNNSLTLDATVSTTLTNSTSFVINNAGTLTLAGGLNLNSKTLTFSGLNYDLAANTVISGNITSTPTATGALTMSSAGTLTLSGTNSYTGLTIINSGTLKINSATAIGGALTVNTASTANGFFATSIDNGSGNPLTLTNAFNINGNFIFKGSSSLNFSSGAVTLGGTRSVMAQANTLTIGGVFTGAQTLQVSGAGNVVLTSGTANPDTFTIGQYAGNYINSGTLTLSGAALLTNTAGINIDQGGSLVIDNTGTNVNNRLTGGSSGTGRTLFLGSGNLTVLGNAATATVEGIGAVTIGAQGGSFGATSGGNIITLTSNGQNVQFTASSLAGGGGQFNSTVMFRGTNLGTNPSLIAAVNSTNFVVTAALTGNNFIGGGGGAGTTNISIIPWAIGDSVSTNGVTHTYGLVTNDNANGIRLLDTAAEYAPSFTNGGTTTNNIRLDGSVTATTTNVGTSTVNSVTLANGATLTGGTVQSTSGVYAANGGANVLASAVSFPAVGTYFHVLGDSTTLALNQNLNFGNFVYKFGTGTLIDNGTIVSTGALLVEGGTLRVGVDNWVSASTGFNGMMVETGGTIDMNGHNVVIPAMTGNGFEGGGTFTNGTATPVTLTFSGETNLNAPYFGNINNGASTVTVTKAGLAPMWLAGGGNYSGGLNVLNGSLVLASDTAQGGNTTANLGDTSGTNNAALLFGGAYGSLPGLYKPTTLNINIQAGSSGIATFGLDNGNTTSNSIATFNGAVTLGKNAYITGSFNPFTSGAPLTAGIVATNAKGTFFVGSAATFSGPGSLTQNGGLIQWIAPSTNGFVIPGGYSVFAGNTEMLLTNQGGSGGTYTFAKDGSGNPLNIGLNGTGFLGNVATAGGAGFMVNLPAAGSWTVNNPFTIGANGGALGVFVNADGTSTAVTSSATFSGAISLGGTLTINNNLNGQGSNPNGDNVANHFTGPMTLNQSASGPLIVNYLASHDGNTTVTESSSLDNAISDGTGAARNPLILQPSLYQTSIPSGTSDPFAVTGSSTYSNGTIVRATQNIVNVTATGVLGTGSVNVYPGGSLRLGAATSVNVAGGARISLPANSAAMPILGLAYNPGNSPSSSAAEAAIGLTSTSSGVLAIDTAAFNTNLDMSALGNGKMFLGATLATGVYGGTTLAPASGPTPGTGTVAPTYRLGGGGGTLTFNTANVVTGSANLIVNLPAARDSADNNLGAPIGTYNGTANIKFNAQQNFTGAIIVNGGFMQGEFGTLEAAVVSGTSQPFGTGANPVYLAAGTLQIDTLTGRNDVTIGDLTVLGGDSQLKLNNNNASTLTIGSGTGIVRANNGNLLFNNGNANVKVFAPNLGSTNVVGAGLGMITVNGAPAPWITDSNMNFMTYNAAGTGIVATNYTVNGAVHNVDGTAGFTLNNTVATDIIRYTGVDADNSMTANHTIYAFEANCCSNGRNPVITAGGAAGPITLTIASGGIAASEQGNNLTFGSATATSAVNVYFGNSGTSTPVEAVIFASTNVNFINTVTAAGVTLSSAHDNGAIGGVTLSNPGNVITGNITINSGTVTTANELGLGSNITPGTAGNHVVLNGGMLSLTNAVTVFNHNIDLGAPGGVMLFGGTTSVLSNISDLSTQVAGVSAGPLSIATAGNTVTFNNTNAAQNQWSGGTTITSTSGGKVVVADGVNFGTGDVTLYAATNRAVTYATTLTLQGNSNLAPSADVNLMIGSTLNLTKNGGAPVIGSIEGSGNVVLGAAAGVVTNPIFGGNNRSTIFDGVISQAAGAGASGVTKMGTGTMSIYGVNTYVGATTVNNGTLAVNGSINSAATVNGTASGVGVDGATLGGSGLIGGSVTVNSGGILAPGSKTLTPITSGVLTVTGAATVNSGATFAPTLASTPAASTQLVVTSTGSVTVSGSTLAPFFSSVPNAGSTYVLIDNQSASAVTGTFASALEGSTVTEDGVPFKITYQFNVEGGNLPTGGNDVALMPAPEPASLALFGLGAVGLLARRRRHAAC